MSKPPEKPEEYSFDWSVFPKDETERDLKISEVAMREGADGFPDSDSTIFSITENEIVGRVRRFYVSVLETASRKFLQLGEETANIKLFLERFDLTQMPVQLKGRVESELTDAGVKLALLGAEAKTAMKDFEFFRQKNGITREPLYSQNWRNIWGPLFVAMLFFLEIVLNGALVSGVVEGLISGISIATTVALLNVILSFVVGKYVVPQFNKRTNRAVFTASAAVCVLHSLFILYLNLAFGIFRGMAIQAKNIRAWETGGEIQDQVLNALRPWESLSQVTDISSVFVIGVGVVFAILALLDGYKSDDPYPGYGDVHRKLVKAAAPFEAEKKVVSDRILRIVDESCKTMDAKIEEFEAKLTRWGTIQNTVQQQFSLYVVWVRQLEQDANKFLNDYRAANIRGRHSSYSTKRSPAYFESRWTFSSEEKDPSKTFSHLTYLINADRGSFEHKTVQTQKEMIAVRDECVMSLRKFLQGVQEEFDKR